MNNDETRLVLRTLFYQWASFVAADLHDSTIDRYRLHLLTIEGNERDWSFARRLHLEADRATEVRFRMCWRMLAWIFDFALLKAEETCPASE